MPFGDIVLPAACRRISNHLIVDPILAGITPVASRRQVRGLVAARLAAVGALGSRDHLTAPPLGWGATAAAS